MEGVFNQCMAMQDRICDAVSVAEQLGRLDLISSLLAVLGIMVGFFGLAGYIEIRYRVKKIAREIAEKESREEAFEQVEKLLPGMVKEVMSLTPRSDQKDGDLIADQEGRLL